MQVLEQPKVEGDNDGAHHGDDKDRVATVGAAIDRFGESELRTDAVQCVDNVGTRHLGRMGYLCQYRPIAPRAMYGHRNQHQRESAETDAKVLEQAVPKICSVALCHVSLPLF